MRTMGSRVFAVAALMNLSPFGRVVGGVLIRQPLLPVSAGGIGEA